MTKDEATKLVAKHGSVRAASRAIGRDRSVIQRALKGLATKPTVSAAVAPVAKPDNTLRGFAVGEATRCAAKRPATTVRARFYLLKKGIAYELSDAAREWVMSEETIRRHAQDADCFRYIEKTNEQWVPCILHPDTAKLYPVK
jgi:hypothetical protein